VLLAVLGFLVSVAYWPGTMSASVSPKWWVLWIGAPAALLLKEVVTDSRSAQSDRSLYKMTPSHWSGLAFLVYCIASLGWAVSFNDGVAALLQLLPLALVFVIAAETEDLTPLRIGLGVAAAISAAVVAVQWWRGEELAGLFMNRTALAEFGAVTLLGLIGLPWKWLPLTACAAVCAFAPMSRGAFLAFAVALPFTLGPNKRFLPWVGMLAVVVVLLSVDFVYNPDRAISMAGRMDIWSWTVANLTWFGYGVGNYITFFPVFEFAHNEPLHFAFELCLGSVFLWAAFAWALPGSRAPAERAMLVAVLAEGMVGFPLHHAATAFVAAACTGHLAGLRRHAGIIQPAGRDRRRTGAWYERLAARNIRPTVASR